MGAVFTRIHLHAGGANHGTSNAKIQHQIHRKTANALSTVTPDRVGREQVVVFVNALGQLLHGLGHNLMPAARRFQCQSANANIAGHHALTREHFEDLQNFFALAEAIEVDGHSAYIQGVRSKPGEMAADARKFAQHDAHPLGHGGYFKTQQTFHSQRITEVIVEVGKVINTISKRRALLIFLNLKLLLNAGMQIADIRFGAGNNFAVQFEDHTQNAVG